MATKVQIRARTRELDAELLNGKSTAAKQRAERQQLIEACRQAGDHDYEDPLYHFQRSACVFCAHERNAAQQRVLRNLVTAF